MRHFAIIAEVRQNAWRETGEKSPFRHRGKTISDNPESLRPMSIIRACSDPMVARRRPGIGVAGGITIRAKTGTGLLET